MSVKTCLMGVPDLLILVPDLLKKNETSVTSKQGCGLRGRGGGGVKVKERCVVPFSDAKPCPSAPGPGTQGGRLNGPSLTNKGK